MFSGSGASQAKEVVESIRNEIAEQTYTGENEGLKVTMSFGLAQAEQGEAYEDLIKRADALLYEAKEAGRNQTVVQV